MYVCECHEAVSLILGIAHVRTCARAHMRSRQEAWTKHRARFLSNALEACAKTQGCVNWQFSGLSFGQALCGTLLNRYSFSQVMATPLPHPHLCFCFLQRCGNQAAWTSDLDTGGNSKD